MRGFFGRFLRQEAGAVSVDLVVLTAACAVLALSVVLAIRLEGARLGDRVEVVIAEALAPGAEPPDPDIDD